MTRLLIALNVTTWLLMLIAWVSSLRNLSGKTSRMAMLVSGFQIYDGENFTDEGRRWRRLFFIGQGLFFASLFGAVLASSR